jgi:hypothetical protein
MALVDPVGPGPNALYDPGYPNEVRKAKQVVGVSATPLDNRLEAFRGAFRHESAFEVLHFLPLYFPHAGRTEVFTALRLLSETEEGIPRAPSARTAFGMAAVGSVLTTPGQRRILGELVQALEDEWNGFFGAFWQGGTGTREGSLATLQSAWRTSFGPALEPFLDGVGMTGGSVYLVPAIGLEGRIFGGSPQIPGDNVLVVSAPAGPETHREAVFRMLRELSFPLVRRAMEKADASVGGRVSDESLAAWAAVRSGAFILEAYHPEATTSYQQFFLSQAGRSVPTDAEVQAAFEEAFPLNAELGHALKEEVLSTRRDGGTG